MIAEKKRTSETFYAHFRKYKNFLGINAVFAFLLKYKSEFRFNPTPVLMPRLLSPNL
jgi:hypothetical protein